MRKSFAVFGLGRYGLAVAKELVNNGADVIAVDMDQVIVNSVSCEIPLCKCADVTDVEVIKGLGISNVDVVVVAMANRLEASVMAVMLCKEVGVKTVVVKCSNETHAKILIKVGADKVVFPEKESGIRLAKNLLSSGFVDVIELSNDISLIDLDVKDEWVGKTLIELDLRRRYSVNVIAVRKGATLDVDVDPKMQLDKSMQLVVIANTSKINKIK